MLAALERMTPEQRRQVPGLRPERADIIVAGLAAAAELLQLLNAADVAVNRYGLREGLLLEMVG
jgi:exopolyphosphatase/guanosine-5'-triphosphate,3'-diphosphate pyrophosphatase